MRRNPASSSFADYLQLLQDDNLLLTRNGQRLFFNVISEGRKSGKLDDDQYNALAEAQRQRVKQILDTQLVSPTTGQPVFKLTQPRQTQYSKATGQPMVPQLAPQTGKDVFFGGGYQPGYTSASILNARQQAIQELEAQQGQEEARIKSILSILQPKPGDVSGYLRLGAERAKGALKGFQASAGIQGAAPKQTPEELQALFNMPDLAEVQPQDAGKLLQQEGAAFGASVQQAIAPTIGGGILGRGAGPISSVTKLGSTRYGAPASAAISAMLSFFGAAGTNALMERRMRSVYGDDVYENQVKPILGQSMAENPDAYFAGQLATVPLQGGLNLVSGIGTRAGFGTLFNTLRNKPTTIIGRGSELGLGAKKLADAANAGQILENTVNSPNKFSEFQTAFLQKIGQASKESIDSYVTFKPTGGLGQRIGQYSALSRTMPGFAEFTSDIVGEQASNLGLAAYDYMVEWRKFQNGESAEAPSVKDALVNLALGSLFIKDTKFQNFVSNIGGAIGGAGLKLGKKIPGISAGVNALEQRYHEGNVGFVNSMLEQQFEDINKGVIPAPAGGVRFKSGGEAQGAGIEARGLMGNEVPISVGGGKVSIFNPDTNEIRNVNYSDVFQTFKKPSGLESNQQLPGYIADLPVERIGKGLTGRIAAFGGRDVVKGEGDSRQQLVGIIGNHVVVRENPIGEDGLRLSRPEYSVLRVEDLEPNNKSIAEQIFTDAAIEPATTPYNFNPSNPRTGAPSLQDVKVAQDDIFRIFQPRGRTKDANQAINDYFKTHVRIDENTVLRGRVVGRAKNNDAIVQLLGYDTSIIRVNPINLERGGKLTATAAGDVVNLADIISEADISEAQRKYLKNFDDIAIDESSPYAAKNIDSNQFAVMLTPEQHAAAKAFRPALIQALNNVDQTADPAKVEAEIKQLQSKFRNKILGKLSKVDAPYEPGTLIVANTPNGEERGVVIDNTDFGPVAAFESTGWEGVVVQPSSVVSGQTGTQNLFTQEPTVSATTKQKRKPAKKSEQPESKVAEPEVVVEGKKKSEKISKPKEQPVKIEEPEKVIQEPQSIGDYNDIVGRFGNHATNQMTDNQRRVALSLDEFVQVVVHDPNSPDEEAATVENIPVFYKGKNLYHSAVRKIANSQFSRLTDKEKLLLAALGVPDYKDKKNKAWWNGQFQLVQFLTDPELKGIVKKLFDEMSDPANLGSDIPSVLVGENEPPAPEVAPIIPAPQSEPIAIQQPILIPQVPEVEKQPIPEPTPVLDEEELAIEQDITTPQIIDEEKPIATEEQTPEVAVQAVPEVPAIEEQPIVKVAVEDIPETPDPIIVPENAVIDEPPIVNIDSLNNQRLTTMRVSDINVDAARFQFRALSGEAGVSGSTTDAQAWNRDLAGVIAVWRDPANNKVYIVNGHNRFALAKRFGVKELDVVFLDSATADEALYTGALINIAGGNATPVDAAKIFRMQPKSKDTLRQLGVSMNSNLVQQGLSISRLPYQVFQAAVNDSFDSAKMALYAAIAENPDMDERRMALLWDKVRTKEEGVPSTFKSSVTVDGIRERVLDLVGSELEFDEGALPGMEEFAAFRSTSDEAVELRGAIRRYLTREKQLLQRLVNKQNKDILDRAGNQLNDEQNKAIAESNADVLNIWSQIVRLDKRFRDYIDTLAKGLKPSQLTKQGLDDFVESNSSDIRDEVMAARERLLNKVSENIEIPIETPVEEEAVPDEGISLFDNEEVVIPESVTEETLPEEIIAEDKELTKGQEKLRKLVDVFEAVRKQKESSITSLYYELTDGNKKIVADDRWFDRKLQFGFNEENPDDLSSAVIEEYLNNRSEESSSEFGTVNDIDHLNAALYDVIQYAIKPITAEQVIGRPGIYLNIPSVNYIDPSLEKEKNLNDAAQKTVLYPQRKAVAKEYSDYIKQWEQDLREHLINRYAPIFADRLQDQELFDDVTNIVPDVDVQPVSTTEKEYTSIQDQIDKAIPQSISNEEMDKINLFVEDSISEFKDDPSSVYENDRGIPGTARTIVSDISAYVDKSRIFDSVQNHFGMRGKDATREEVLDILSDVLQGYLKDTSWRSDKDRIYSRLDPNYASDWEYWKSLTGKPEETRQFERAKKLVQRKALFDKFTNEFNYRTRLAHEDIANEYAREFPEIFSIVGVKDSDPYVTFGKSKSRILSEMGFNKSTDEQIAYTILGNMFPWTQIDDASYENELAQMSRSEIINGIATAVRNKLLSSTDPIIYSGDAETYPNAFDLLVDDIVSDYTQIFLDNIPVLSQRSDLQASPTEDEGQMGLGLFQFIMNGTTQPKTKIHINNPRLSLTDSEKQKLRDSGFVVNDRIDAAAVALFASQESPVIAQEIVTVEMPSAGMLAQATTASPQLNIKFKRLSIEAYRITDKATLQVNIARLLSVTQEGQQMSADELEKAAANIANYMDMLGHAVVSKRLRAMADAAMLNVFGRRYKGGAQIFQTDREADFMSYDEFMARDLGPLYFSFKKKFNAIYAGVAGKVPQRLSSSQIFESTNPDIVRARAAALAELAEEETKTFLRDKFPAIGHILNANKSKGMEHIKGMQTTTIDPNTGRAIRFITAFHNSNIETVLHEIAHGWLEGLPYYAAYELASAMGKTLRIPSPTNTSIIPYEMHEEFAYGMMLSFANMDLGKFGQSQGWVGTTSGRKMAETSPIYQQLLGVSKYAREMYQNLQLTRNIFNSEYHVRFRQERGEEKESFSGTWRVFYQTTKKVKAGLDKNGKQRYRDATVPDNKLYLWRGAPIVFTDYSSGKAVSYEADVLTNVGRTSNPSHYVNVRTYLTQDRIESESRIETIQAGQIKYIGGTISGIPPAVQFTMSKWLASNRGLLGIESSVPEEREKAQQRIDDLLQGTISDEAREAFANRGIGEFYTKNQKINVIARNFGLPFLKSTSLTALSKSIPDDVVNKLWANRTVLMRQYTDDPIATLSNKPELWYLHQQAISQRIEYRLKQNAKEKPGLRNAALKTLGNPKRLQRLTKAVLKAHVANIAAKGSVFQDLRRIFNPPTSGYPAQFEIMTDASGAPTYSRQAKIIGIYDKRSGNKPLFVNLNDGSVVNPPYIPPKGNLWAELKADVDSFIDGIDETPYSSRWSQDSLNFNIPSIRLEFGGQVVEFGNTSLKDLNELIYKQLIDTGITFDPKSSDLSYYVNHPMLYIAGSLVNANPHQFARVNPELFAMLQPNLNTTADSSESSNVSRLEDTGIDISDAATADDSNTSIPEGLRNAVIADSGKNIPDYGYQQFTTERYANETQRSQVVSPQVFSDTASRGVDGVYQSAVQSLAIGEPSEYRRKINWITDYANDTFNGVLSAHNAEINGSFYGSAVVNESKAHFIGSINFDKSNVLSALGKAAHIGRQLGQPNTFITSDAGSIDYGYSNDGYSIVPALDINLVDPVNTVTAKQFAKEFPDIINGLEIHNQGNTLRVFMVPSNQFGRSESNAWTNDARQAVTSFFSDETANRRPNEIAKVSPLRVKLWNLGSSELGGIGRFTEYERILDVVQTNGINEALPSKEVEQSIRSARMRRAFNDTFSTVFGRPFNISESVVFRRSQATQGVKSLIAEHWNDQPIDATDIDSNVLLAYGKLIEQLKKQHKSIGIQFEFTKQREEDGIPVRNQAGVTQFVDMYDGRQELAVHDISKNRHLYIQPSTPETFGASIEGMDKHPLWQQSNIKDANQIPMRWIDVLNGIQQAFNVSMHNANFQGEGESLGYVAHAMITEDPWAIWALANETIVPDRFVTSNIDRVGLNGEVNFATNVTGDFQLHKLSLPLLEDILTGCNAVDDVIRVFAKTLRSDFNNYNGTGPLVDERMQGSGNSIESNGGHIIAIQSSGSETAIIDPKFGTIEADFGEEDFGLIRNATFVNVTNPTPAQTRTAILNPTPPGPRPTRSQQVRKAVRNGLLFGNEIWKAGAAGDASPILMQNYILSVDNPVAIGRQIKSLQRVFANPNLGFEFRGKVYNADAMYGKKIFHQSMDEMIRSRPTYQYAKHLGLTLAAANIDNDLDELRKTNPAATLEDVDELAPSINQEINLKWMRHLPGHGQSQRMYSLAKDVTKMTAFDSFVRHLVDAGYNPTPIFETDDSGNIVLDDNGNPKIYKSAWNRALRDVSSLMNVASGDVRFSDDAERDRLMNEVYSYALFSPRWWASRMMLDRTGRTIFENVSNLAGAVVGKSDYGTNILKLNRLDAQSLLRRDPNVGAYHWKLMIQAWGLLSGLFALIYGSQALYPHTMEVSADKSGTRVRIGDYTFRAPGAISTQLEWANAVIDGFTEWSARKGTASEKPLLSVIWDKISGNLLSRASPIASFGSEFITGYDAFGQPAFVPDEALKVFGDEVVAPVLKGFGVKGFSTPEMNSAFTKRLMWWWLHDIMDSYKAMRDTNVGTAEALIKSSMMGALSFIGGRVLYDPKELRAVRRGQERMGGPSLISILQGKTSGMDLLSGKSYMVGEDWDAPVPASDVNLYESAPRPYLIGSPPDDYRVWF